MRTFLKFLIPALLISVLLILAACTPSGSNPSVSTADPTTDPLTPSETTAATAEETQPDSAETATVTEPATEAATEAVTEPTTNAPETEPADKDVAKAGPETLTFEASVTVTEAGGKATVTHKDGLTYTATGYDSAAGNKLTFVKGLTLTLDPNDTAADFNRFVLGYTSTQPLYGKVSYTLGGKTVTDDFYLEAGEHTFSCVIGQYLKGKKGAGITQMTFETCNDKSADFALCVLKVMDYPVYGTDSDTYFIETLRYKLGIRLGWGGGINYIEDKNDGSRRLDNLVNQADTGRLIQQSYYGVQQNSEYTPGHFNGSTWAYNPVQGGDKAQNHSRIIDIVVTERSVYVKSQPQDWAKDNEITPSYMENIYTVYSDRIQVDNRFVDFSGWTHRYAHQELPAFYTVSYLSRFTLYNGTKPWTNDTMSYRDDLNFWGDSTYYNDCTFLIKKSNTETWCAWTSPAENFGIGLYVPNVESMLAGRHAFNNSPNSTNGACNYVAPVNTIILTSFEALEYSHLISTGSVEEIRATFKENKDFATNETLHKNYQSRRVPDSTVAKNENSYADMDKDPAGGTPIPEISASLDLTQKANTALVISSSNTSIGFSEAEGAMELTVKGADPHVTIVYDGAISANTYKTIEITYMIPTSNSNGNNVTDLFLCAGNVTNPDANASVRVQHTADGQYHTLVIDLSDKSFWQGDIHKIRLDYMDSCAAGDKIYIKNITLQ